MNNPSAAADSDFDQRILRLLTWLGQQAEGASQGRICKQLDWSASELQRCLTVLQPTPEQGGMGLIEASPWRDQTRYRLSERGRLVFGAEPATPAASESQPGLRRFTALRIEEEQQAEVIDRVAEEVPVAMVYNDQPFAVMLASPCDLEDFGLGFALAEGIVAHHQEFRLVELRQDEAPGIGYSLHAHLPQARIDALADRRRQISARSGCGACGSELLQLLDKSAPQVGRGLRVDLVELEDRFAAMQAMQSLNQACGGVHAAAWWSNEHWLLREDIGRHNAVDKVIGAAWRGREALQQLPPGCLLVTSRASYEIVHKAAHAGIEAVFAMSAPTSLAIELAERCGITLGAFVRQGRCTLYAHAWRCAGASSGDV